MPICTCIRADLQAFDDYLNYLPRFVACSRRGVGLQETSGTVMTASRTASPSLCRLRRPARPAMCERMQPAEVS